jgi:hypothetical protein
MAKKNSGRKPIRNKKEIFVPLADVPDLVWRVTRKLDSSNHFADMDQPAPKENEEFGGKTLLELCSDSTYVDPAIWVRFYEALGVKPKNQGALPFRVWQIFDAMAAAVRGGDIARYVCAAGIIAHYVGDACQPLHISHLHHGARDEEKGVHSAYETQMLNRFTLDLVQRVARVPHQALPLVDSGRGAAVATVALMRRTILRLPPQRIIDVYNSNSGRDRTVRMWEAFGRETVACVADGAQTLAMIWKSAWRAGNGDHVPKSKLVALSPDDLRKLYDDPKFLPAARLPEMIESLHPTASPTDDGGAKIPILRPLVLKKKKQRSTVARV